MGREYGHRIVGLHHEPGLLQLVHRQPRNDAGDDADDDGAPAIDVAGGGGDRHQARDHAVDRADDRRLAVGDLVHQRPDQEANRRRRVGVEHGGAGVMVGEIRIAAVEAVPAEP